MKRLLVGLPLIFLLGVIAQAQDWKYQDYKDPMTDKEAKVAALASDDESQSAALSISNVKGTLFVFVFLKADQFWCPGTHVAGIYSKLCSIRLRFDQQEAEEGLAMLPNPQNSRSLQLIVGDSIHARKFLERLTTTRVLKLESPLFGKGPRVFQFHPIGLDLSKLEIESGKQNPGEKDTSPLP